MPSILLEAGFITHPVDRSIMRSSRKRAVISKAIAKAIDRYRHQKSTSSHPKQLHTCQIH